MKKITVENYRDDKYYPKVVQAFETILATGDVVAPIERASRAGHPSGHFGLEGQSAPKVGL